MTPRPLLWIAASAVALGIVGASPATVGATDLQWRITIDELAPVVEARTVTVAGDVGVALGSVETVTVRLVPQFESPGCDPAEDTVAPADGRYQAAPKVSCNGPYQVQVTARGTTLGTATTSGSPETDDVAVAERPAAPATPGAEFGPGWTKVTWPSARDADAAGWIVEVDGEPVVLPVDQTALDVPMDGWSHVYALQALRWGAGGPGSTPLPSGYSSSMSPALMKDPGTDVTTPPTNPPSPSTPIPGSGGTRPPSAGTPSPPTTADHGPTRGTGSGATVPEGYSEEIPYGRPDGAFVPDDASADQGSADGEQSAAGSSAAGLYRTSDKKSPGLVAPFALALLMITIAAHIAWYLRRSKRTDGGQVTLL